MNTPRKSRAEQKISELARDYERKGFRVIENPRQQDLPKFLKSAGYVPDLIARSSKRSVVIEVKSSETIRESSSLKGIADIVNAQKGWEFVLVVTNPKEQPIRTASGEINIASISDSFKKFISLSNRADFSIYSDMLFVYGWSVLEGLLLASLKEQELFLTSLKSRAVLRESFSYGLLASNDYSLLTKLVSKRNSLIHGEFGIDVSSNDLSFLRSIVQRLYHKLAVQGADDAGYLAFLRSLSKEELDFEVDSKIADTQHEILEADEVISKMAETNSVGYGIDEYEVVLVEMLENECKVRVRYSAVGDQDEDKPFSGSKITGEAVAVIDSRGEVKYSDVKAEIDDF